MGQQFDTDFDFSIESLVRLDASLEQWRDLSESYRGHDANEVLQMAVPITAYVGEVFRRNFAGTEWITVEEEGQIAPPHLRLENGARVNVMKKAIQALTGAEVPAFAGYFQTVNELISTRRSGNEGEDKPGI
jgi:hypothetical protein